jgi:chloramphenicol 3-O phosphotransferase
MDPPPGQIIIVNGVPRSGKSSIVDIVQSTFDGLWMNLGVDIHCRLVTPERYQPGVGLRPRDPASEPQHPVWPLVPALFAALYDSIAAHSRHGLNVVTDIGHHDQEGRGILADCARRFDGLPVLFVGLHCPLEVPQLAASETLESRPN